MTLMRLVDTATVYRRTAADDDYGGEVSADVELLTNWRCLLTLDHSMFAQENRGQDGPDFYKITGGSDGSVVQKGDQVVISSVRYLVHSVDVRRDPYGSNHHVMLWASRMKVA